MNNLTPLLQFDFTSIISTVSKSGTAATTVQTVSDLSDNNYLGTIHGGCSIDDDPIMGNCLNFNGTTGYVSLSSITDTENTSLSSGFTITAWVKFNDIDTLGCLLNFGQTNDTDVLNMEYGDSTGSFSYTHSSVADTSKSIKSPDSSIKANQWTHLAITVDKHGTGRLYVDGIRVFKSTTPSTKLLPSVDTSLSSYLIGWSGAGAANPSFFEGRLAWLSVYGSALKIDQVNEDMIQGETGRQITFRKSLPIGFDLFSIDNNNQAPILYIQQEGEGKDLYLNIINKSGKKIDFTSATGAVSKSNYHFQLQFRHGTLASNFLTTSNGSPRTFSSDNWNAIVNHENSYDSISFLYTATGGSIAKGETINLTIPKVNANAMGGARNTNVVLKYQPQDTLAGERLQSLSIVNHTGQKHIPIHADVVGAPQVLNDGSTLNNLLFRIENIGSQKIPLSTSAIEGKSAFTVSVLTEPEATLKEWALVKQTTASSMALHWPVIGVTQISLSASTSITLAEPLGNKISADALLNIQPPTGGIITITLAADVDAGQPILKCTQKQTIPKGSVVSLASNVIGTLVETVGSDVHSVKLTSSLKAPIPKNTVLRFTTPSPTNVRHANYTLSQEAKAGHKTLHFTSEAHLDGGDIVTLPSQTVLWQSEQTNGTDSIEWSLTNEQLTEIAKGQAIEFLLTGIVCGLPSGQSIITISYQNIPGYWDGRLVIPIQKGPVIYDGQKVGIGTDAPEYTLEIYDKGDTGPSLGLTGETNEITLKINEGGAPEISLNGEGSTINIGSDENKIYSGTNGKLGLKADDELLIESSGLLIESNGSGATKINTPVMMGDDSEPLDGLALQIIAQGAPRNDGSDINSGIAIASSMGGSALNIGVHGSPKRAHCYGWIQSTFANSSFSYNPLALNPNGGNVGIGTPSPSTKLDVDGTITGTGLSISGPTLIGQDNTKTMPGYTGTPGGLAVSWNNSANNRGEVDLYNTNSAPGGDAFHFYQMTSSGNATLLVALSQNGNLGIGTSVPGYPIDVVGGTFQSYTGKNSTSPPKEYGDGFTSSGNQIFADVDINIGAAYLGNSYVAHSDNRLKDIIAKANSKNDLETVLQLSVTNYSYKNKARLGNRENKGLIAQELEKVFPHAVSQHTGFTPDIYAFAHKIKQDKRKNELTIQLDKKHGLKKGDIVRLITDSDENLEKKVAAVPNSKTIVIKNWTEKTKKLFVYGKKVNDLRGIDYHQVAMLGISATQQLHKELEATQSENETLRKESKQLKKQFDAEMSELRKELKSIKNLISTKE